MPELIAQGADPKNHWRCPLTGGRPVVIGRATTEWAIPWDRYASRAHAEIIWNTDRLRVRRLPDAHNPVFFRGEELDTFEVRAGECFAIGDTAFTLIVEGSSSSSDSRPVLQERAVNPDDLKKLPFRDAPRQLDVLRRLPSVISSAADDNDLSVQLVTLLLAGILRADVIALVVLDPETNGDKKPRTVTTLHWEARRFEGTDFQPSRRLVQEAVARQQRTVLHVWAAPRNPTSGGEATFTMQGDLDWAFCTPVRGESCPGWALYVAGGVTGDLATSVAAPLTENELSDDLKFAELTADVLGSLRQVRKLQRDQARLNQFFSPTVQKVLTTAEPEAVLRPRETDVTVIFCDLRGFSHTVETEAVAGHLLEILERVSQALGVMTQQILGHEGVVADFLGDAALGFWGWPLADPGMVRQACLAAIGIRQYYESHTNQVGDPLAGFRVGIGIATGRAVAGRIGPNEQAKVTVFGPVVNLAARLESMTKQLHVPILIDEQTARVVRQMGTSEARVRRLAKVRPYGLETPLVVSELLPPESADGLSNADLAHYERALDAFLAGDWNTSFEALHQVSPRDRGKDILTGCIIANNHIPPAGWNGVIELGQK
ncbi:MAG: adenylate/guanylate cyclase domain-containing protein [Planctomycetaceae bacterium]|nr:adenylate/guanylate cyclase domain-containing protein [Planctomycetaceae bacterium]